MSKSRYLAILNNGMGGGSYRYAETPVKAAKGAKRLYDLDWKDIMPLKKDIEIEIPVYDTEAFPDGTRIWWDSSGVYAKVDGKTENVPFNGYVSMVT